MAIVVGIVSIDGDRCLCLVGVGFCRRLLVVGRRLNGNVVCVGLRCCHRHWRRLAACPMLWSWMVPENFIIFVCVSGDWRYQQSAAVGFGDDVDVDVVAVAV